MALHYSFVIPVYNRPEEIRELLDCFLKLKTDDINYEIVIVEDGSENTAKDIAEQFKEKLPLMYFLTKNSGAGQARNFGMQQASGNYFIILDSDVLLPENYLLNVNDFLQKEYADVFGGADAAHSDFTSLQKAINFAMTSFLTTGGIRGSQKSVEKFKPRSFNMGISKKAFEATGGFSGLRVGEDLDLSIRLQQAGFKTVFIPGAEVFHKRRSTWKQFYRQVSNFGKGRPVLNKMYPGTFSPVVLLPSLFLLGLIVSLICIPFKIYIFLWIYLLYFLLVLISSTFEHRNIKIGLMSVIAVLIQFIGYGSGYLKSYYHINIRGEKPEEAFPRLFR